MDWVSAILGLSGCYLVGKGVRYGWLLFALASSINTYIGIHAGILGLSVAGFIYCLLELKGWYQHNKRS